MSAAQEFFLKQITEAEPNAFDPDKALLGQEEYNWLKDKVFTAEDQKEAFEYVLRKYSILRKGGRGDGYEVVIDENTTALDVRDKSYRGPTLFVPAERSRPLTGDRFLPLLAHEIEGHARQSMIGKVLFGLGGDMLALDDEQLYEGYGLRLEKNIKRELFGNDNFIPRVYYPFAVKMAERGHSFYEIFSDQVMKRISVEKRTLREFDHAFIKALDEDILENAMKDAWTITYRVMRGHTDTSNPEAYAMAKDLGYMRGWIIDKNLLKMGWGISMNWEKLHAEDYNFLLGLIFLKNTYQKV